MLLAFQRGQQDEHVTPNLIPALIVSQSLLGVGLPTFSTTLSLYLLPLSLHYQTRSRLNLPIIYIDMKVCPLPGTFNNTYTRRLKDLKSPDSRLRRTSALLRTGNNCFYLVQQSIDLATIPTRVYSVNMNEQTKLASQKIYVVYCMALLRQYMYNNAKTTMTHCDK